MLLLSVEKQSSKWFIHELKNHHIQQEVFKNQINASTPLKSNYGNKPLLKFYEKKQRTSKKTVLIFIEKPYRI